MYFHIFDINKVKQHVNYHIALRRCPCTDFVHELEVKKLHKVASSLCLEKLCVYCNLRIQQNLFVQCSLNFKFGTYNVIKCIFIFLT